MKPVLISPTIDLIDSWIEFIQECDEKNISGFWDYPDRSENWKDYVKLEATRRTINRESLVSSSTFWLVNDGEILAATSIRHRLNEKLKKFGGHIGYYVKPSQWKNGYGTKILELALLEARNLGIRKTLITCSDDNIASAKIIEKNGGVLEKKEIYNGKLYRYYWIGLSS